MRSCAFPALLTLSRHRRAGMVRRGGGWHQALQLFGQANRHVGERPASKMKSIPNVTYCFDAEWGPCVTTGRLALNLADSATNDDVVAAMWKKAGATAEKPRPFLKLALSRIYSISAVCRKVSADGVVSLALHSYPKRWHPNVSESSVIERFFADVSSDHAQLVGFNSCAADLPILFQRGMACGCQFPLRNRSSGRVGEGWDYFDRDGDAHLDLAHVLTGGATGAAMPSLNEIAAAVGIPGKLDHSGESVFELWRTGKFDAITHYNETDALTTHLLFLRAGWTRGLFSEDQFDREMAAFHELVDLLAKTKSHVSKFVDVWRARRKPLGGDSLKLGKAQLRAMIAAQSESVTVVAEMAGDAGGRVGRLVEILVPLEAIEAPVTDKLRAHLVPVRSALRRYDLCRMGYDSDGTLVAGRNARGGPLRLCVPTPDLEGIIAAVQHATIANVDEWDSSSVA